MCCRFFNGYLTTAKALRNQRERARPAEGAIPPLNAVNRLAISRELFYLCNWLHKPWYLWNMLPNECFNGVDLHSEVFTLSESSQQHIYTWDTKNKRRNLSSEFNIKKCMYSCVHWYWSFFLKKTQKHSKNVNTISMFQVFSAIAEDWK